MRAANYVEETTTSIAGTSGDGAVTLSQITNVPRFSTVLGTQNTTVRYIIEDTVNKKFECGIGNVSSNVLTRTQPQVTWTGTTYTDNGATALQFGSSPTSGDIKIRMAPLAEDSFRGFSRVQSVATGDAWRDYRFSDHFGPFAGNGTGGTFTADREYYFPYKINNGGVLSGAQFHVSTAVTSSNMKWALYCCGDVGLPSTKIVDFTTTSTATTGVKTDTATGSWNPAGKVRLTPGWYFVGMINSHGPNLLANGTNNSGCENPLGRKDGYGAGSSIYIAGNYTTGLPASPTLTGATLLGQANAPLNVWIGLKRDAT